MFRGRVSFLLVVLLFDGLGHCQDIEGENLCSPKACDKSDNQKVVCGSDGLSYPNRCQLEQVRCHNKNVTFVKRGPCKKQRSCLEWRDVSLDFPQYRFKARCKKNGQYEPGQCHPETDMCWCVTPEGIPLPDTVRPRNRKNDSKPIRCGSGNGKKVARSPSRRGGNGKMKMCKNPDKKEFNNNLLESFHQEYDRERNRNDTDTVVVTWKFKLLDTNNDDELDRREYRDIKRLVGKALKPKKCAKAFPKLCDLNSDAKLTLHEWKSCFQRDGLSDGGVGRTGGLPLDSSNPGDDGEDYDGSFEPISNMPSNGFMPNSGMLPSHSPSIEEDSIAEVREDENPGCIRDRLSLIEDSNSSNAMYIPECTPDGRYKKVQCYHSVGYCWCVNEDNGQTIAGTSKKDLKPDCDSIKPPPKPLKGCPDEKRQVFVNDLLKYLRSFNHSFALDLLPKEEQILWSFNLLDKNNNRRLDRSEWKSFKEMVLGVKHLRKCGKKLPRYCDTNKDKVITSTEWLDCLTVQGGITAIQPNVATVSPRTGKINPLSVLKDD